MSYSEAINVRPTDAELPKRTQGELTEGETYGTWRVVELNREYVRLKCTDCGHYDRFVTHAKYKARLSQCVCTRCEDRSVREYFRSQPANVW